jgi:arylsulfatase A-like enzyme
MRFVVSFLALAAAGWAATAPTRPNIVFMLLDNVGQEWFGCYGSEEKCTPNIDRLAATGVRVENCYTAPICGPSRTVLLTGRYPHRTGFRLHHDAALYSGGGLDPRREVLFPRALRDAGYVTGLAGKWQVNNLYDEPTVLREHGFTEHLAWPGSVDADQVRGAERERYWDAVRRESVEETVAFIQHIESRYWDPVFIRNGRREVHPGKFGPDVAHAYALDFLRRNRDRPFLLYLPMVLVHGETYTRPVVPTPDNRTPGRSEQQMFADMLRYGDRLVGEIVAELENLGLRENTIVFVASDNGTESRFKARRNGRVVPGGLYTLTEAGGNVVLLANAPARIPGGRTLPLADFTDVYPTVCELAGVPVPPEHGVDGRSFAGFLLGQPRARPHRDWILNEYHDVRVVRDTRYKLYSDGRFFDVEADPAETHDLKTDGRAEAIGARRRLQQVLATLPPDTPAPFLLRSQSGFKLRTEARAVEEREASGRTRERQKKSD